MKFLVEIDIKGLPTIEYYTRAKNEFKSRPEVDILVATHQNYERSVCFRSGSHFDDVLCQKGPGDSIMLEFEDFIPNLTNESFPEWYEHLKSRIISVEAQEQYGGGQGIKVTEGKVYESATALVRHQQLRLGDDALYCVKIYAKGPRALVDALVLHSLILKGE